MSNYLRDHCQVGQTIVMEAPLGSFYLREVEKPLVFIAGGTGLSAFLGAIWEQPCWTAKPTENRAVLWVNKEADLCEQQRLQDYATKIANFNYHPIVTQATETWSGKTGFIHEHLNKDQLAEQAFDMYLCGPPPMIEAVKTWLDAAALVTLRFIVKKFYPAILLKLKVYKFWWTTLLFEGECFTLNIWKYLEYILSEINGKVH